MLRNTLRDLIESRGINRFRFMKDTGIAQTSAYSMIDNPLHPLSYESISRICEVYRVQPGDFLVYVEETSVEETTDIKG